MNHAALARAFVALDGVTLTSRMIDDVLARATPALAALHPHDATRAAVFRAFASGGADDDRAPPDTVEFRAALDALRSASKAAIVSDDDGCR